MHALAKQGYRITSNRHRVVARIDRENWREYMAQKASPWDPEGEGMQWVIALGRRAADTYRRTYSRDKVELDVMPEGIPNSTDDTTGYVPKI